MLFQMNSRCCLCSQYEILNEKNELAYKVRGTFWSLGDKLTIRTGNGSEVGMIKSSALINFNEQYEFRLGDKLFAEFKRDFKWYQFCITGKYKLNVAGPDDYLIRGNFWQNEFSFERLGRTVATVSKKFFSLGHKYGIEIEKSEDQVPILASAVVLDLCRRKRGAAYV